MRIENIAYNTYKHKKSKIHEIIKYEQNKYFGKEDEYRKEGYVDSFGGDYLEKGIHSIPKIFFEHKEFCYTIAFLDYNKNEPCISLRTVSNRLLELSKSERDIFFQLYELIQKKLEKKYKI